MELLVTLSVKVFENYWAFISGHPVFLERAFRECGVNVASNTIICNAVLFLCRKTHLKCTTLLIIHDLYSLINFPQLPSAKPACLYSYEQTWLLGYFVALR